MPTQERLRELFYYSPDGVLIAKKNHSARPVGSVAGHLDPKRGYIFISVHGKSHRAHRLIWVYHNGPIPSDKVIDHIDRNRTNNSIENLRILTRQENQRNTAARARSGYPITDRVGIYFHPRRKHWRVTYYVGTYHSQADAEIARDQIEQKLGYNN